MQIALFSVNSYPLLVLSFAINMIAPHRMGLDFPRVLAVSPLITLVAVLSHAHSLLTFLKQVKEITVACPS